MEEFVGSVLKVPKSRIEELSDYQVLMGFAGFGNVGFLVLSHLIETLELESFTFWGNTSWFYKNNLESIMTGYIHRKSKTILITTRVPIFVSTMSKHFWDKMIEDVISWNCRRYIIIGGLREDTRSAGSTEWAAFVPTVTWTEKYGHQRTLANKLTMIGPLSSLETLGTMSDKLVLGLLAYCNLEQDMDASKYALAKINEIAELGNLDLSDFYQFDYSFLSLNSMDTVDYSVEEEDQDTFDVDDLI